jgi:PAS domain S-box-containing protein
MAPESRETVAENLRRRIEGEARSVHYSFVALRKDGSRIDIEVLGSPTIYNGRPAIIGTFIDVTESKRREQALRFTQFAIDRAADGIFWRDEQGRFVYANDAACRSLGYTRDELLSLHVYDINPDYLPETCLEHLRLLRHRRFTVFESRHRAKDGRIFPVEITSNLLEFDGREFVCAFARDITERRRLEEELRHSQKMEAIGRLAGGVAHDFNNLLAVISGYSESLLRHLPPDDRLRLHAEEIGKAADRGASLTRQLLAFSRRQIVTPQILDLNRIICDFQEMLRRTINKSITIEMHLDTALGQIKADRGQMEQVLMNLALNARDAMEQTGGVLAIRTENTEVDHTSTMPCNLPPGRYVKLMVRDTGCGMDPELQAHIFEPFFTTKAGKGTGLGLSIVYGIVQQARGCIRVHSEPEQGSTFQILLPRVEDNPSPTSANLP